MIDKNIFESRVTRIFVALFVSPVVGVGATLLYNYIFPTDFSPMGDTRGGFSKIINYAFSVIVCFLILVNIKKRFIQIPLIIVSLIAYALLVYAQARSA